MRSLCAIFFLLATASIARADAVAPPPSGCPNGTYGQSSHTGPYCAPHLCTLDLDCSGGAVCREEAMCIARQRCGGGRLTTDGGVECTFDAVHGLCTVGDACDQGTCQTRRVCVDESSSTGCGCRAGGGARSLAPLAIGAAVLGIALARRERRR